jgi:hypothetical protein
MRSVFKTSGGWASALLLSAASALVALGAAGCQTDAFCWDRCPGDTQGGTGGKDGGGQTGGGGAGGDECFPNCNTDGGTSTGGSGGSGPCQPTNGGIELCDGVDNDCNGTVDDSPDINLSSPKSCGTCTNNCYEKLLNADPNGIGCTPSPSPGKEPGTCTCGGCAPGYQDLDKDCVCEYYCVQSAPDDTSCNNKDDDCDGVKDEDVDLCKSTTDCGKCGGNCVVLHGTPACVHTGNEACSPANTQCQIKSCDAGWHDLDKSYATGCEYQCDKTNNGAEKCGDSLDNDCDGKIDEADDLTFDPQIGKQCFGDPDGICGQIAHAGTTACVGNKVVCQGANVLTENQTEEVCNGKDDDCDGVSDDNPTDAGDNCGQSNVFPCTLGKQVCQSGQLSCVGSVDPKTETCNGQDDDCDGQIDDMPSDVGTTCGQSGMGACKLGVVQCVPGGVTSCVGAIDPKTEACNGIDDDCNGMVDDVAGAGTACGQSNVSPCKLGSLQCVGNTFTCVGAIDPAAETCNGKDDDCDGSVDEGVPSQACVPVGQNPNLVYGGLSQCKKGTQVCGGTCQGYVGPGAEVCDSVDNDCDGIVDNNLTDLGACNVPPPPPAGATSPCKAGTKSCLAGVLTCNGSVGPTSNVDSCGVDANCDGVLSSQPDLQNDVANCGACGTSCYAGSVHGVWSCQTGMCVFQGCETGYYDLDGDKTCEYACQFKQAQEICNGEDDNCDGQIDENVLTPTPTQVCGVSPSASRPECTSQVSVACQAGAWKCTFPGGVCGPNCATATEVCDNLDNDCDGLFNENVPNFGKACASDDGVSPGHGACRTTGTYVCNGQSATTCSAVKANCSGLPGGCTEACDGVDNDCDGAVDETYASKGANAANFVKPAVTKVAGSRWIYTYEASRPSGTASVPGTGNGYQTSAPAGTTLDKTLACSVPNRLPWFNVTPQEAEQTCQAMGGFVCATADWTSACQATQPCNWGYSPRGATCTSTYTATKFCNLGPSFDFNALLAGDQDGLLPTGSSLLQNCWADWSNLQGNTAATNKIFDLTGNLREITKSAANTYPLMGGAFNTGDAGGATCSFSFYTVDQTFKLYDLGFRCCFGLDPTL